MQLSEKECSHNYNSNQEITHQHHNFDNCFVCNFTLSSFISSDISPIVFKKTTVFVGNSYVKSREILQFFKGSLFALRAPPKFLV